MFFSKEFCGARCLCLRIKNWVVGFICYISCQPFGLYIVQTRIIIQYASSFKGDQNHNKFNNKAHFLLHKKVL